MEKSCSDKKLQILIKENEILSNLSKNKIDTNTALNQLLVLLSAQRNEIDSLSEEHISLENAISKLDESISALKKKNESLKVNNTPVKLFPQSYFLQSKPSDFVSYSDLVNKPQINGNFLQMSVTNFRKKQLKPITEKKRKKTKKAK